MANDDEIGRDPDLDGLDLAETQAGTRAERNSVSPFLSLRTLAAGIAGAAVTALIWRGELIAGRRY